LYVTKSHFCRYEGRKNKIEIKYMFKHMLYYAGEKKGDQILILVDSDVLIEILDESSKKGEAALKKIVLLEVTDFTKNDAALSAKLEVKAEKKGSKAPRLDAMIAAVAINRGFKLFTFNKKHFEVFDDLVLF